jgi:hypothetical protein
MALLKGSRYERSKRFAPTADGEPPFLGTRPRDIGVPDGILEHTVQAGQRLDLLALHYYNDDRKWWRILDANPSLVNAGDLTLEAFTGLVILIPRPAGAAGDD